MNFKLCLNLNLTNKRNTNVLIYVKRRLGMCARKLGKLKEATKIFRDVILFLFYFTSV